MKTENRPGWLNLVLGAAAAVVLLSGCSESGAGAAVYENHCASCHGRSGQGLRALYPPLEGSLYLGDKLAELPCLIVTGSKGSMVAGKKSRIRMPAFPGLSIEEISSLISYLGRRWGKDGDTVSAQRVGQWLDSCP